MSNISLPTRLATLMELLGTNASVLARCSGADHSLISKWQRGSRPLSRRSKQLAPVAAALLRLDKDGRLGDILEPYRQQGESAEDALCVYLTSRELPALPPRAKAPVRRTSGEYTVEYRVYLGKAGARHALLTMMDYVMTLPPGRELMMLLHGRYEWMVGDPDFTARLLDKLRLAFERGTTLKVINRVGYSITEAPGFAGPWLQAHLKGHVRSFYYDDDLPQDIRMVVAIPDYCSLCVDADEAVEDGLYGAMHSDPREIRRGEDMCREYLAKGRAASQYGFFTHPKGTGENTRLWQPGPMPCWSHRYALPIGSFSAICRVPVFGVMTKAEFAQVAGNDKPEVPGYFFSEDGEFAKAPHRLILCRDDIRDGLNKQRRQHEALCALLHRRAFVTRDALCAQLGRLLAAMDSQDDFEVALVPRVAFDSLKMGMVCWHNSSGVAWMLDGSESAYASDRATSVSLNNYVDHVWDNLLAGWKRQDKVRRQLRKWLAGKELDKTEDDSAIVRGWSVGPKG